MRRNGLEAYYTEACFNVMHYFQQKLLRNWGKWAISKKTRQKYVLINLLLHVCSYKLKDSI